MFYFSPLLVSRPEPVVFYCFTCLDFCCNVFFIRTKLFGLYIWLFGLLIWLFGCLGSLFSNLFIVLQVVLAELIMVYFIWLLG